MKQDQIPTVLLSAKPLLPLKSPMVSDSPNVRDPVEDSGVPGFLRADAQGENTAPPAPAASAGLPDTLSQLMDAYLRQIRHRVKASTFARYRGLIDGRLRPRLGDLPLAHCSGLVAEQFGEELLESGRKDRKGGLSEKTVRDILALLCSVFRYGVRHGLLPDGVMYFTSPRVPRRQIRILAPEDEKRLIAFALSDVPQAFGVAITLFSGLRLGELCALRWEDIDADGILQVRRTLQRISVPGPNGKTCLWLDTPKTGAGLRQIPLPPRFFAFLKEVRGDCGGENFVLTGKNRPIEPRNYYEKYLRWQKRLHMEKYTFHALRHTFATHCIEQGMDPKTLSEILGHASTGFTFDRYVHPSLDLKKAEMCRLDALFPP